MPDPIIVPIEDVLDLHTFNPREVGDLIKGYLFECIRTNIYTVRIIHGKGTGRLKARVLECLRQNRFVASFRDAPPQAGGWGATIVELNPLTSADGSEHAQEEMT